MLGSHRCYMIPSWLSVPAPILNATTSSLYGRRYTSSSTFSRSPGFPRGFASGPIYLFRRATRQSKYRKQKTSVSKSLDSGRHKEAKPLSSGETRIPETIPHNVWIVFGGNGAAALDWIDLVRDFPDPCTGFLFVDYPGYGICEGKTNPRQRLSGLAPRQV
jgi:hypothetical protein